MSQFAGIEADFATWRPVQGRKVLQLVFEVPIERTQHVLDVLGIPQPGASKWCAIALLNEKAEVPQATEGGGSPKKPWSEYSRSQQAAILISDPNFRAYFGAAGEEDADRNLKCHLRIKSKRELDNPANYARWDEFIALYHMHRARHG